MPNETIKEVLAAAVAALDAGQRAAMLTLVHSQGSTPRHSGAKMLLRADGSVVGTIGGGTLEERALLDARQAIGEGRSRLLHYEFSGRAEGSVGLCGGAVEVSIEILEPSLRLLIIGAGHIAQPLAAIAGLCGLAVIVVDDRPEWANRERFPTAKEIHIVAYERETETLAPLPVTITPSTAVLLATWGWDEPALAQVLDTPAFYLGLVASRRKLKLIIEALAGRGIDPALMERVHAPAGLDVGGETPGEIAVSIMAEILMVRHGGTGQAIRDVRRLPHKSALGEARPAPISITQ